MEGDSGEKGQETYFLLPEDFSNFPEEIKPYTFPEKINRQNFTNWFIQSFSVARGNIDSQALWMRYIDNKTGFDSRESLLAFEDAGGLDNALTREERKAFLDAFSRVRRHELEEVDLHGQEYEETFRLLMDSLLNPDDSIIPNWKNISPEEFLTRIRRT